jgi:opacity protein-like surface antigen
LAGYQVNRIVAIEMDYTHYINNLNFRGFVWNKTAGPSGFGGYLPEQIHAKPVIYASQANVGYTFANGIRPFVLTGLGFLHLNADKDVYDADTFNNVLALRIGTGIEYAPVTLQGWALRASWTADYASMDTEQEQDNIINTIFSFSYTDDVRLSNFNLGVSYKF